MHTYSAVVVKIKDANGNGAAAYYNSKEPHAKEKIMAYIPDGRLCPVVEGDVHKAVDNERIGLRFVGQLVFVKKKHCRVVSDRIEDKDLLEDCSEAVRNLLCTERPTLRGKDAVISARFLNATSTRSAVASIIVKLEDRGEQPQVHLQSSL